MIAPSTTLLAADSSLLVIAPREADEEFLDRGIAIADRLGTHLQVYCPIVVPPLPHSGVTPNMASAVDDNDIARARGRRMAHRVFGYLNRRRVDAHVEAGICESMTGGILGAAARLQPGVVLVPEPDGSNMFGRAHSVQLNELWSKLRISTWIVSPCQAGNRTIVGMTASHSNSVDDRWDDPRVAATTARLAHDLHAEAHLLCCDTRPLALETALDTAAPASVDMAERRERTTLERLYGLADREDIPHAHVHLRHGEENEVLEQMTQPLELGLVVKSGHPTGMLGGLLKRYPAAKLVHLNCDLLVLGECDVPHA